MGKSKLVEPIRDLADITAMKKHLYGAPKDHCLFVLGVNTNLRASDLLGIRVSQVRELAPMGELVVIEKKTRKLRRISLNNACTDAIQRLLGSGVYDDTEFLFKTHKSPVMAITSVSRLVKKWCTDIGLKGNYAAHSLRKTFGYHQRVTFGVELPVLMECFNHSSQQQTMTYLGIQPEEIKAVYANEI